MISDASRAFRERLRAAPDLAAARRITVDESIPPLPGTTVVAAERGEWIVPPTVTGDAVLLYCHGGGYGAPYHLGYRRALSHFAASAARVFALDYRLAPRHPYPAALEDSLAAYRWLLDTGVEPGRLVIGGDSAGGGLAVATLLRARAAGDPLPAAQVLISPWVDLEGTGESMTSLRELDPYMTAENNRAFALAYVGNGQSMRDPLVSPVHADLTGLPPTAILVGGHEILLDDARRLHSAARRDGVPAWLRVWDGMWHVFPVQAGKLESPEVAEAVSVIGDVVRSAVSQGLHLDHDNFGLGSSV